MSDRLQSLLDHMADQVAGDLTAPPLTQRPAHAPGRRRRFMPAAAATSVLLVVATAALADRYSSDPAPRYAGTEPELGTMTLPVDVIGRGIPDRQQQYGDPQGPADLLAKLTTRAGELVLAAQPTSTGYLCTSTLYLPPAVNMIKGTSCSRRPDPDPPLAVGALSISGYGPGGAPGGIKDPPVTYGAAPTGTRTVEFSGSEATRIRVPAYDGGERYDHRAYYMANWDLTTGSTLVRALDRQGRELARVDRKADPANLTVQCAQMPESLRSHLGRASMIGEKYARSHPDTADKRRLAYPDPPLTTAAATARFDYARTQLDKMGAEEIYDYRLAANVVIGEAQCFPDPALQQAARQFKDASG